MISKVGASKKIGDDSGGGNAGKLLKEIDAISKALHLDRDPLSKSIAASSPRPKLTGKNILPEPKSKDKKSIWNWPLRAFSHVRNRRFTCCFTLQVHSIEGLPASLNDVSLCVHWKRRDGDIATRPVRVFNGTVEFEEKLTHTCSVYGSRSGSHHSAKYEAKYFLLYTTVFGMQELDLGKDRVDLTRLLPPTLEELEEEKSSMKWTTSFKLSGKAKGATLNVSFGYLVVPDNLISTGKKQNVPEDFQSNQNSLPRVKTVTKSGRGDVKGRIQGRTSESLPSMFDQHWSVEARKDLNDILPESQSDLASSLNELYKKFEEEKSDISDEYRPELDVCTEPLEPLEPLRLHSTVALAPDAGSEYVDYECAGNEFSVAEQGGESPAAEQEKQEGVVMEAANASLAPDAGKEVKDYHYEDIEFSVTKQGRESPAEEQEKSEGVVAEALKVSRVQNADVEVGNSLLLAHSDGTKVHPHEESHNHRNDSLMHDCSVEDEKYSEELLLEDLESAAEEHEKPEGAVTEIFKASTVQNAVAEVGNSLLLAHNDGTKVHPHDEGSHNHRNDSLMHDCSQEDAKYSEELLLEDLESAAEEPEKPEGVVTEILKASTVQNAVAEVGNSLLVAHNDGTKLHPREEESHNHRDYSLVHDCSQEDEKYSDELLLEELESALNGLPDLEKTEMDSLEYQEDNVEVEMSSKSNFKGKSLSFDDATESVVDEFLNLMGIDHSPFGFSSESEFESPRESLLRQFEEETLTSGSVLFDFTVGYEQHQEWDYSAASYESGNTHEDIGLSSVIQAAEKEHQMAAHQSGSKSRANMLENLETEALMREWGLNEESFQYPPPQSSNKFGSVDSHQSSEPLELPPLGEGLGPLLQTNNGGFLRSMNPSLFSNSKNDSSLIMQVSSPVVVPAEMGSGITEILQRLASGGIEKLSMQANKLMPLDDISGKTMQQVAWEAAPTLEAPERHPSLQHEFEGNQESFRRPESTKRRSSGSRSCKSKTTSGREMGPEYMSLEDLAPLAMDKIEALSVEGLRIQSGMSDEDAPSVISAQCIGEISAVQSKGINITGSLGLEGAAGLQLLDVKDNGDDVDGLMSLSLTLDEWMRLDSGDIGDEGQISEQTSRILAAHHASSLDLVRGGSKGEKRRGKGSGRKRGLLGNNFTVALLVQLRDPQRNFDPVGTPMLALIQVERVFAPPKPTIYRTVSDLPKNIEEDYQSGLLVNDLMDEMKIDMEESIPQFKITEVHVAGLKTESDSKKLWGTATQQHTGSRWLLASGMGKNNKQPAMKPKTVPNSSTHSTTKVQPSESFWSISSRILGKAKELAGHNPLLRNPDISFRN